MIRIGTSDFIPLRNIMSVTEFKASSNHKINGIEIDHPNDRKTFIVPFSYYSSAKELFSGVVLGKGRYPKLYIFSNRSSKNIVDLSSDEDKQENDEN